MSRAKDRATDLPDADLFGRVKKSPAWQRARPEAAMEPRAPDEARTGAGARARLSVGEGRVDSISGADQGLSFPS
jgi:hypothetical protein